MRKLILDRIEKLSELHNGFSISTMRWRNFAVKGVHLSEVGFVNLTDEDLLEVFELIVKRHNMQM